MLLLLLLFIRSSLSLYCNSGTAWHTASWEDKCLFFHDPVNQKVPIPPALNFVNAELFCQANYGPDAHLVSIHSIEQHSFIQGELNYVGMVVWTGLTDSETEGDWKWISGEPVVYNPLSGTNSIDTNCAGLLTGCPFDDSARPWAISSCNTQQAFICELVGGQTPPTPPTIPSQCVDPYPMGEHDVINTKEHDFYYDTENELVIYRARFKNWAADLLAKIRGAASDFFDYGSFAEDWINPYFSSTVTWNSDDGECDRTIELRIPIGLFSVCAGVIDDRFSFDTARIISATFDTTWTALKVVGDGLAQYIVPYSQSMDLGFVWDIPTAFNLDIDFEVFNTKDYLRTVVIQKDILDDDGSNFRVETQFAFLWKKGGIFDHLSITHQDIAGPFVNTVLDLGVDNGDRRSPRSYYQHTFKLVTLAPGCGGYPVSDFTLTFTESNSYEDWVSPYEYVMKIGMTSVCDKFHLFGLTGELTDERGEEGKVKLHVPLRLRGTFQADLLDFASLTLVSLEIGKYSNGDIIRTMIVGGDVQDGGDKMALSVADAVINGPNAYLDFKFIFGLEEDDVKQFYTDVYAENGNIVIFTRFEVTYVSVRRKRRSVTYERRGVLEVGVSDDFALNSGQELDVDELVAHISGIGSSGVGSVGVTTFVMLALGMFMFVMLYIA